MHTPSPFFSYQYHIFFLNLAYYLYALSWDRVGTVEGHTSEISLYRHESLYLCICLFMLFSIGPVSSKQSIKGRHTACGFQHLGIITRSYPSPSLSNHHACVLDPATKYEPYQHAVAWKGLPRHAMDVSNTNSLLSSLSSRAKDTKAQQWAWGHQHNYRL